MRYLATRDSQPSLSFAFQLDHTTVCHIVNETCEAVWLALNKTYLKTLSSVDAWKSIADQFHTEWDFPHCIGAIDGKHVGIECLRSSYFNYKNFHSMVLLVVCYKNYSFIMVDIGGYGRDNDASIFSEPAFGQAFDLGLFHNLS